MKISSLILFLCSLFWIQVSCLTLQKLGQTSPISDSNKTMSQTEETVKGWKPVCPEGSIDSADAPLKDRAVCPWLLKENYDKDRVPNVIHEAVCLCGSCLKVGKCVPIYADIPILKKLEDEYKSGKLSVAVACSCILGK